MLTRDGLKMSKNKMFFSSAKAERELGYSARPYADGIRDATTLTSAGPSRACARDIALATARTPA